jgi:hypothetical protein
LFGDWAFARTRNAEIWQGPFDTREEAIAEASSYITGDFWLARTRPVTNNDREKNYEARVGSWTFMVRDNPPPELYSPNMFLDRSADDKKGE